MRRMAAITVACVVLVAGRGVLAADGAAGPDGLLDECDVVWTTPSKGPSGSMPLGNGDVGMNLWVDPNGDVVMLLSKTDAWDAHCRLLKLGRLRVSFRPRPQLARGFRQELRLRRGCATIEMGRGDDALSLTVRVDAGSPVVRIEGTSARPVRLTAKVELWRTKPYVLTGRQRDSARGVLKGGYPLEVSADHVVDTPGRVTWYHRNERSCWPVTMKVQGLAELARKYSDPLLGRTFGGSLFGPGLVKANANTLRSAEPTRRIDLAVCALTMAPATRRQWLERLDSLVAAAEQADARAALAAHEKWWADFWHRSWIYASGSIGGEPLTVNDLPLRIGADSDGRNRLVGDIAGVMVFSRALSAAEVSALAAKRSSVLLRDGALAGCWTFEKRSGNAFADRVAGGEAATVVGEVAAGEAPAGKAVRLDGRGYLQVPDCARLDARKALTLAAWVRPSASGRDGRIIDKSRAGTSNGYLLDTYPGGESLRMITAAGTLIAKGCLRRGRWSHVAGVFDSAKGIRLYVDGRQVASGRLLGGSFELVTQTYALQRFINACGGRGAMPIKFNGSIFTVDGPGYGPDYRRWGGCYWFQNTRLPYWAMIPCGDWDLTEPLMKMYRDMLPLRREITRLYFHHDGAFFVETGYFWGTPCNDDYGWKRAGQPVSLMLNRYIRRHWESGLELAMMMLDRYDYTQDERFLRRTVLPHVEAVLAFYENHYGRDVEGKLRIEPAQSLETWWQAVNPMPEVAGLHAVLPRLLKLPEGLVAPQQRSRWEKLLAALPAVPTRVIDGREA
ncbi:MAG: hypothetical protein J7M21_04470, partial [Planctomycetes bacterium]|nr:hypothetical protein [Planctomycetota bacterium]